MSNSGCTTSDRAQTTGTSRIAVDSRATILSLRCLRCGTTYPVAEMPVGCPDCFQIGRPAAVAPDYDLNSLSADTLRSEWEHPDAGIWKYHQLLPVPPDDRITLAEGGTPLLQMRDLQAELGLGKLLLKDERRNPTGSFKDRFFAVCIARAHQIGAETVVIASSGNGGVSAAAYASAAGLRCVVITTPAIAPAWRAAIETTGATLIATNDADRWEAVRIGVDELGWYPLTNYVSPPVGSNWYGIEGYKSIAYEIAASLDWNAPDWVAIPTSRGDGLCGIWRGFVELHELGIIPTLPRMAAVERFPSLSIALADGLDELPTVKSVPTCAVSIGSDTATYQALATVRQSEGIAISCSDEDLLAMVRVAGQAGLFVEISAAAGLVGIRQLAEDRLVDRESTVVAVLTATGLTDPASIIHGHEPLAPIHPTKESIRRTLDG